MVGTWLVALAKVHVVDAVVRLTIRDVEMTLIVISFSIGTAHWLVHHWAFSLTRIVFVVAITFVVFFDLIVIITMTVFSLNETPVVIRFTVSATNRVVILLNTCEC